MLQEIQVRGGGGLKNDLILGGVWIFSGITQYCVMGLEIIPGISF